MDKQAVIAIFDIGKTNKKLFLLDENYKIVFELSENLEETVDEDGDACENLKLLTEWINESIHSAQLMKQLEIKAVNFSSYGASFVFIDETGNPVAPLYNYLKPFPADLQNLFYDSYGGEEEFSSRTASPVLGSLNSGMQLYRLKYEKPDLYKRVKYALHLPQYLSYLFSGVACSDITSIGCHTNLWDFTTNDYHEWVKKEAIIDKLAPLQDGKKVMPANSILPNIPVGTGLHDSSSALIPYLVNFSDPFVLISTGTWCISLNPFNGTELTKNELKNDSLCYMTYEGKHVKASRIFAGYEHEQQVERIGQFFNLQPGWYKEVKFDPFLLRTKEEKIEDGNGIMMKQSMFSKRDISKFANAKEAYHQLMFDLARLQVQSTRLVLMGTTVSKIFVDGGFGKNELFMNLLAALFPGKEVYAASVAQASAIGAALAIRAAWNNKLLPLNLVQLKKIPAGSLLQTGVAR